MALRRYRFINLFLMGLGTGVSFALMLPAPAKVHSLSEVLPLVQRNNQLGETTRQKDKAAIRQVVQTMQDGHNTKNGKLFASGFAKEHDYIIIDGMFLPNITREDNARSHQALYDSDRTSSLGGNLGKVGMQLNVAKIRFLTPEIAVVHIQSQSYLKEQPDKRAKNIMTTVMQKQEGKWSIVAFHNAPVQKSEEDDFGFVIDIKGLKGKDQETQRKACNLH